MIIFATIFSDNLNFLYHDKLCLDLSTLKFKLVSQFDRFLLRLDFKTFEILYKIIMTKVPNKKKWTEHKIIWEKQDKQGYEIQNVKGFKQIRCWWSVIGLMSETNSNTEKNSEESFANTAGFSWFLKAVSNLKSCL